MGKSRYSNGKTLENSAQLQWMVILTVLGSLVCVLNFHWIRQFHARRQRLKNRKVYLSLLSVVGFAISNVTRIQAQWYEFYNVWYHPSYWLNGMLIFIYTVFAWGGLLTAFSAFGTKVWLIYFNMQLAMAHGDSAWISLVTKRFEMKESAVDRVINIWVRSRRRRQNQHRRQDTTKDFFQAHTMPHLNYTSSSDGRGSSKKKKKREDGKTEKQPISEQGPTETKTQTDLESAGFSLSLPNGTKMNELANSSSSTAISIDRSTLDTSRDANQSVSRDTATEEDRGSSVTVTTATASITDRSTVPSNPTLSSNLSISVTAPKSSSKEEKSEDEEMPAPPIVDRMKSARDRPLQSNILGFHGEVTIRDALMQMHDDSQKTGHLGSNHTVMLSYSLRDLGIGDSESDSDESNVDDNKDDPLNDEDDDRDEEEDDEDDEFESMEAPEPTAMNNLDSRMSSNQNRNMKSNTRDRNESFHNKVDSNVTSDYLWYFNNRSTFGNRIYVWRRVCLCLLVLYVLLLTMTLLPMLYFLSSLVLGLYFLLIFLFLFYLAIKYPRFHDALFIDSELKFAAQLGFPGVVIYLIFRVYEYLTIASDEQSKYFWYWFIHNLFWILYNSLFIIVQTEFVMFLYDTHSWSERRRKTEEFSSSMSKKSSNKNDDGEMYEANALGCLLHCFRGTLAITKWLESIPLNNSYNAAMKKGNKNHHTSMMSVSVVSSMNGSMIGSMASMNESINQMDIMLAVIEHEQGFRLFMQQLFKEFAYENLACVFELMQFRRVCMKVNQEKQEQNNHSVPSFSSPIQSNGGEMNRPSMKNPVKSLSYAPPLSDYANDPQSIHNRIRFPYSVEKEVRSYIAWNSRMTNEQKFLALIEKYISESAEMSVNLSFRCRRQLLKMSDNILDDLTTHFISTIDVSHTVFDKAIKELMKLMLDSFHRFRDTPQFDSVLESLTVKLSSGIELKTQDEIMEFLS